MLIRPSTLNDLPDMLRIYACARAFMAAHGNPRQWGINNWPPEDLLRQDIAGGHSYVCECGGQVVGTFAFFYGEDVEPTYRDITQGAWLAGGAYGVVHRVAGDGSVKGIGRACLDWAFEHSGRHLRIDTHGDNTVMQSMLVKNGFVRTGTIFVEEDNDPRLAYERLG